MGATHTHIPPRYSNANADVESVHATIEIDILDVERFSSRADFLAKITTYQLYCNIAHNTATVRCRPYSQTRSAGSCCTRSDRSAVKRQRPRRSGRGACSR